MFGSQHVLVTGANGYIGAHVVRALLDLGARVTAASLHGDHVDARACYVPCDVLERAEDPGLYTALGAPDVCVHLGYRNGFSHNAPTHLADLPRHYAFIQAMAQGGCRAVAVMGSMHEVGYHEGVVTEATPCAPMNLYGIAKNALREAVMGPLAPLCGQTAFKWLRGYYIVGDDLRSKSIFGKMRLAASEGRTHFPFTSGRNRYDFIDVDDLAVQIAVAALDPDASSVINCCSGKPVSLGERAASFIEENRLGLILDYGAFPDRPYDSPVIFGDPTAIREMLVRAMESAEGTAREIIQRTFDHTTPLCADEGV